MSFIFVILVLIIDGYAICNRYDIGPSATSCRDAGPYNKGWNFVDWCVFVERHTARLSAFSFDAKGAKEKANGQKHSRLEHERMARAQYSLFFPIFASASSSTGRADVKIKKKTPIRRFRSLRRATKALPLETASRPKGLSETSNVGYREKAKKPLSR